MKKFFIGFAVLVLSMIALTGTAFAYTSADADVAWEWQPGEKWKFKISGQPVKNDWVEWNGQWYLFDRNGFMLTGWQMREGYSYYLAETPDAKHPLGACFINEVTPDGQWVNETGVPADPPTDGLRPNPYGNKTCVEVSISEQTAYVYNGPVLVLSTPVVTGRLSNGRRTPTGTFAIYSKETGRYLQGTNSDGSKYKSYVNFWMPFHYGYGLHDANWRGAFGGDIYRNGGSHGCVNMPYDAAAALYSIAYVGMPVIIHD